MLATCGAFVSFAVAGAGAQVPQASNFSAEPTLDPVITGAPYSAEGITTVKMQMFDGTRIERSITARFFRDSAGRVRREQSIVGLEVLDPSNDVRAVVHIVDPVAGVMYTLNPGSKTAHRLALSTLKPASQALAGEDLARSRVERKNLGSKDIDGLTATGYRKVTTIPVGQVGNDRAIEISDEQWESTELKVVLYLKHIDPRTGEVEFKLTKISRQEPAKELFTVPAGFKIMDAPATFASQR